MRKGLSLIEVLVCCVVLTSAAVPVASLLMRGSRVTYRSRLAYLAVQVAREQLEEVRQARIGSPLFEHLTHATWRPVTGTLLTRLGGDAGGTNVPAGLGYPTEYEGIETRFDLQRDGPDAPVSVTLWVRWREVAEPGRGESPNGLIRFDTVVCQAVTP